MSESHLDNMRSLFGTVGRSVSASVTASSLPRPRSRSYSARPQAIGDTIVVSDGMTPRRDEMGVDDGKVASVAPHQCDDPALYLDAVGWEDAGFVPFVTRL
jgi:hypothetical protein